MPDFPPSDEDDDEPHRSSRDIIIATKTMLKAFISETIRGNKARDRTSAELAERQRLGEGRIGDLERRMDVHDEFHETEERTEDRAVERGRVAWFTVARIIAILLAVLSLIIGWLALSPR